MPLDNTIALVDAAEVKRYLGLDPDAASDRDEFIESLINAASKFLINECNTKFIEVTTAITELFDGDDSDIHFTKNVPLTSTISASTVWYWDGDSWVAYTGATLEQDDDKGKVWFTNGGYFWRGNKNWKITYTYGYTRESVPADLKKACIELVTRDKKKFDDGLLGVKSKSFVDQSITYNFDEIPKPILRVISKYKRWG